VHDMLAGHVASLGLLALFYFVYGDEY